MNPRISKPSQLAIFKNEIHSELAWRLAQMDHWAFRFNVRTLLRIKRNHTPACCLIASYGEGFREWYREMTCK